MATSTCQNCAAENPAGFKFCGECGAKFVPVASTGAEAPAVGASAVHRDEFRDVTILFADLSGFTAMSERLDPEAVHALMNDCFEGLGRIIQCHGGHIDKYIGDSIMALFGAPTAHEDDPIRAAETALEMQMFLSGFAARHAGDSGATASGFKMRIGLNSGLVLAGAIGTKGRQDYSVMGDAVNIASRLESVAEPGTILASGDFKRRVEHQFAFGAAHTFHLKGKERAIEAFVLEGERRGSDVGNAGIVGEPFIGREQELETIRRALSGNCQQPLWIEVRGPLGIGKSRLVETALGAAPRLRILQVASRPTTAARPFALARRILYTLYQNMNDRAGLPQTREAFTAVMAPVIGNLEPYMNAIWYLAAPDALGLKTPDPDPLTLRRTIDRGLALLFANLARMEPPYVLFLDAYDLADRETRALLEGTGNTDLETLPAVITTARGDGDLIKRATDVIDLDRLDEGQATRLVKLLTRGEQLPAEMVKNIVTRAGGVPLFIKELVRKVEEDRVMAASAGTPAATTVTAASSVLPSSLLGVMIARLDRLDAPLRELLSQCAVQGAEFLRTIAGNVWTLRGGDGAHVPVLMDDLHRRQLVEPVSADRERWSFAQVLMQNACYDQMLKRDRRTLHRDVAAALVTAAGSEQGVSPEILATHYEVSEQWRSAAEQNVRAGHRAADLYANADALARFNRALSALAEMGDADDMTAALVFTAHRGAALVLLRVGDYNSLGAHTERMRAAATTPATGAEADRLEAQGRMHRGELDAAADMLALARARLPQGRAAADHMVVLGSLLYDHADVCYRLGRNSDAADLIQQCRSQCDLEGADAIHLNILEGRLAHTEGRFEAAVELYERAHQLARGTGSLSEQALTSNYMGNAARDVGRYDEAEGYFTRALDVWNRTGMREAIAGAHNNLANLAISRGDPAAAEHHYGEALRAFDHIGNASGKALALTNLAILAIETGDAAAGIARASVAKELLAKSGNRVLLGLATVVKGEALIEMRRLLEADTEFQSVLAGYTVITHPLAMAGAHRGVGRVRFAEAKYADAIASLEMALELYERLARAQEAARTEVHLAEAQAGAGRISNASVHIENACRKFKEIGAERDLARAEASPLAKHLRTSN